MKGDRYAIPGGAFGNPPNVGPDFHDDPWMQEENRPRNYRGPIGDPTATAGAGLSRFSMARGHGGRMGTLDDVMGASPPNVGAGGGGRGLYRDGDEPLLMSGKGIMPQPSAPERGRGGLGIMPTPMQPKESYSRLMDSLSNKARSPGEAEAMLKQMWDHEPTDMMGEIIARAAKEIGIQPPWAQQKR